jgi:hypothetical protein
MDKQGASGIRRAVRRLRLRQDGVLGKVMYKRVPIRGSSAGKCSSDFRDRVVVRTGVGRAKGQGKGSHVGGLGG